MVIFSVILFVVAWLILFAASIWLIVEAFRVSAGWGLICLFVPFGVIVFAIKYWGEAYRSICATLAASALMFVAGVIAVLVNVANMPNTRNRESSFGNLSVLPEQSSQYAAATPSRPNQSNTSNAKPASTPPNPPAGFSSESATQSENIQRGKMFSSPRSRAALDKIEYAVDQIAKSDVRGIESGNRFSERSPDGGMIIGLRVGLDDNAGKILNIRPIFQTGENSSYGDRHGPEGGAMHELVAASGYALSGVIITHSTYINSIQAIFCRVTSTGELEPAVRQVSKVVGNEQGTKRRIFSEWRPVVEVFGWSSNELTAIGLGAVQADQNPTAEALAQSAPASRSTTEERPLVPQAERKAELESDARPTVSAPLGSTKTQIADNDDAPKADSAAPGPGDASFRNWSSASGNFSVSAKFRNFDGKDVILENREGKTVRVAIEKLSQADRDYLKSRNPK